jgi:copper chaperone NosL
LDLKKYQHMKKLVLISIMAVATFMVSCNREPDYSPRIINYERDICAQCLMGIADSLWAVQTINTQEDVLWFDDIGCLVEYMKTPNWQKFVNKAKVQFWVGNSENGGWIDAQKAYYNFGKHTPMGYGYSAVPEPNDTTFTFNQVVKRIEEGKTMREEFLQKHKMMGKGKMHQ